MSFVVDGICFEGGYDGFVVMYGLIYVCILELMFDGCGLVGEDLFLVL